MGASVAPRKAEIEFIEIPQSYLTINKKAHRDDSVGFGYYLGKNSC
jgi:hypothetical protein